MKKAAPATLLSVGSCLLLAFGAGGASGSGGLLIWPLFGTTNQLMAGLTLLVIAVMLVRRKTNAIYIIAPMAFILLIGLLALAIQIYTFFMQSKWFLCGLAVVVLVAGVLVTLESASVLRKEQKAAKAA